MQSFSGLKNFKISYITIKRPAIPGGGPGITISKYLILLLNFIPAEYHVCFGRISKYLILLLNSTAIHTT